ncbi:hypothetical protein Ais01nite_07320 [Asanoa ishikariensis]|uniref:Asp23 family, cell envelope-related function n=1 Tax=Asanoa ishikariensis TaxID=137265 RepID=A0A1H3TC74_9ACTN|nr:hypothetical protein [Asanoa ishikariensis]GIF62697.1 hypothetical protein Ais01nite_07320 [Asanoa ishikariensis]SDZ47846.1 hypothetical protein SAMN05421684_5504 [Asanoa ishikariensis]
MTDAMVDGVDIDKLAAAAEDCPAVDALVEGPPAMAATYLPRRRVTGIRIEDDVVTIQVRLRWESTVGQLARQVWSAVRPLAGGHRVDIVVADITAPATGG